MLSLPAPAGAAPFAYLPTPEGVAVIDLATHNEVAYLPQIETFGVQPRGSKSQVYTVAYPGARLVDVRTQAVVASIPFPELNTFIPHPLLPRAYVYASFEDTGCCTPTKLQVLDTDSLKVVAQIDVAGGASMVFDASGSHAYLPDTRNNSISVVDISANRVVSKIAVESPVYLAIHPSGNLLYATSETSNGIYPANAITVLDLVAGTKIATIQVGTEPGRPTLNPSGSRVFVSNRQSDSVSVIDTASNNVIATVPVGPEPLSVDVHPNGDEVYVLDHSRDLHTHFSLMLSVISAESLSVTSTIALREGATAPHQFVAGDAPPGAVSGLWGNTSEPGWGVQLTQRRNTVFGALYSYDAAGAAHWYVASACNMTAVLSCPACVTNTSCTGPLYEVDGARFLGTTFNSAAVTPRAVGSLRVDFRDRDNATLSYTIADKSRTAPIARNVFKEPLAASSVDYTDLWWNATEPGWGLGVTHQSGTMFLSWFIYDNAGRATWLVASNCVVNTAGNGCTGTVYRASGAPGPITSGAFDPSAVKVTAVGIATLSFSAYDTGMFTYTVDGISGSKSIVRNLL